MSFGGIMLMVYVPLISKAIIISLLMLIVFMIFLNAVKFMSIITIDVDSLKSKIKSGTKQKVIDETSNKDDDIKDDTEAESNKNVDETIDAKDSKNGEDTIKPE